MRGTLPLALPPISDGALIGIVVALFLVTVALLFAYANASLRTLSVVLLSVIAAGTVALIGVTFA